MKIKFIYIYITQIKMGLYNSQGFSPQSAEYKTKFIYKGDMKV
jgi:hypothetical protein